MAKILSVVSRAGLARLIEPLARGLLRVGVSPDAVTVAGSAGVLVGAIGFATRGHLIVALVIVTLSALTDMLDGAMARQRGAISKWGALLDSTMDRISDGAVFGAVAYWLAVSGHPSGLAAALICLVTGQVISYVKARAEGLGLTANVGVAERAERLIIVGIGGLLDGLGVRYALEVALWILAVLSVITIGQRMIYVYRQVRQAEAALSGTSDASPAPGKGQPEASGKGQR
jgi:CDP-diacylglycerol--glycerol-3-phosphate 3-phosphatidyltransferase